MGHDDARLALPKVTEALASYTHLWVGLSGGLDSCVLLHWLSQHPTLKEKLRVIHVHHGLSPHADTWQGHCEAFCREVGLLLQVEAVQFQHTSNLEAQARDARRAVFKRYLKAGDALLLGHHAQDQAETLLLQLFRGAGVDGLAAMASCGTLGFADVWRPFLYTPKKALQAYALAHHLTWIEDESNTNTQFSRNFIRHALLPIIEKKWPAVVGNLQLTHRHCEDAAQNLKDLAIIDCPELQKPSAVLHVVSLLSLPRSRLRNVLRHWLRLNAMPLPDAVTLERIIDEVCFARDDAMPKVTLGNGCIRRQRGCLHLLLGKAKDAYPECHWVHFPEALKYPDGRVFLEAKPSTTGIHIKSGDHIAIRYRKNGETLRLNGQTKTLKKLWQVWGVPVWQRQDVPLLYINGVLAAVIGYAIADDFYSETREPVFEIMAESFIHD